MTDQDPHARFRAATRLEDMLDATEAIDAAEGIPLAQPQDPLDDPETENETRRWGPPLQR